MAKRKKRTPAQVADPFSPGTVEMLERHSIEQETERIAKGRPEPRISPFMTEENPAEWIRKGAVHQIEEASKETGVRTDTTKADADLKKRSAEARAETEELLGLTRGVTKKKKKK